MARTVNKMSKAQERAWQREKAVARGIQRARDASPVAEIYRAAMSDDPGTAALGRAAVEALPDRYIVPAALKAARDSYDETRFARDLYAAGRRWL